MILAAASDPGGARALLPVIAALKGQGYPVVIVNSGFLSLEAPPEWPRASPRDAVELLSMTRVLVYTSSVKDHSAPMLAKAAESRGIFTVQVFDSWAAPSTRLDDGEGGRLSPNAISLMDQAAHDIAMAEGLEASKVRITGHPAFAGIKPGRQSLARQKAKEMGFDPDRLIVGFVSEPVTADIAARGSSAERGYREHTVLEMLARGLVTSGLDPQLAVLPHPREDKERLRAVMRGVGLEARLYEGMSGSESILACHGVTGMASILLYEAWLLGFPCLSLQPGLLREDLRVFSHYKGMSCHFQPEGGENTVQQWANTLNPTLKFKPREELALHHSACERLVDLVLEGFDR